MSDWEHVLDALVRERGPALVRYAALLTGDLGDADDLVQEALVRSFSQGRPLRETLAAESYVRRAILSIFLDGYRRRRRWAGVRHLLARPDAADGPEAEASSRIDVQAALLTLRPRLRACVVLRFYDDLTVPEIARQLGLSSRSRSTAPTASRVRSTPCTGSRRRGGPSVFPRRPATRSRPPSGGGTSQCTRR